MKILISGTMADLISRKIDQLETNDMTNEGEFLCNLFTKCIDSWFKRHPSSSAMSIGTNNEVPTLYKLTDESCVKYIYEVGLLQHNTQLFLGVSPDAIVIINGGEHDGRIGCVEIKIRCAPSTIQLAEVSLEACGRTVICTYDDPIFKKCVPVQNRLQVLHQATITNSTIGMFMTAKIEKDQGCIVQIVIFSIPFVTRQQHLIQIQPVAEQLLGWFYDPKVV